MVLKGEQHYEHAEPALPVHCLRGLDGVCSHGEGCSAQRFRHLRMPGHVDEDCSLRQELFTQYSAPQQHQIFEISCQALPQLLRITTTCALQLGNAMQGSDDDYHLLRCPAQNTSVSTAFCALL